MFPGQLVRVTGETTTLVTAAEFKTHVREDLDNADNNTYITSLITAATTYAEQFLGRTTVNAIYLYYLTNWPSEFLLPRPPIASITSITYKDSAGATQTWASTKYVLETYTGRVALAYGESYPAIREQPQSITVTYTAGYGATAASTPEPIKLAVKQIAAHWYENRKAVDAAATTEVPLSAKNLLIPYRLKDFA